MSAKEPASARESTSAPKPASAPESTSAPEPAPASPHSAAIRAKAWRRRSSSWAVAPVSGERLWSSSAGPVTGIPLRLAQQGPHAGGGRVQPALHRAFRNAEFARDRGDGQVHVEAEHEQVPLFRREAREGVGDGEREGAVLVERPYGLGPRPPRREPRAQAVLARPGPVPVHGHARGDDAAPRGGVPYPWPPRIGPLLQELEPYLLHPVVQLPPRHTPEHEHGPHPRHIHVHGIVRGRVPAPSEPTPCGHSPHPPLPAEAETREGGETFRGCTLAPLAPPGGLHAAPPAVHRLRRLLGRHRPVLPRDRPGAGRRGAVVHVRRGRPDRPLRAGRRRTHELRPRDRQPPDRPHPGPGRGAVVHAQRRGPDRADLGGRRGAGVRAAHGGLGPVRDRHGPRRRAVVHRDDARPDRTAHAGGGVHRVPAPRPGRVPLDARRGRGRARAVVHAQPGARRCPRGARRHGDHAPPADAGRRSGRHRGEPGRLGVVHRDRRRGARPPRPGRPRHGTPAPGPRDGPPARGHGRAGRHGVVHGLGHGPRLRARPGRHGARVRTAPGRGAGTARHHDGPGRRGVDGAGAGRAGTDRLNRPRPAPSRRASASPPALSPPRASPRSPPRRTRSPTSSPPRRTRSPDRLPARARSPSPLLARHRAPHRQAVVRHVARARVPAVEGDDAGVEEVEPGGEVAHALAGARGRRRVVGGTLVVDAHGLGDLVGADVARGVREHEEAAGRERREEPPHDVPGVLRVAQVLEHRDEHEPHRLGEVERTGGLFEDLPGLAQVGLHVVGGALGGADEERAGVREDDGVVVHVDDPRLGRDALRDLVRVVGGGDARTDVEELPDALRGEVFDGAAEEGAVGADRGHDAGVGAGGQLGGLLVHRVVVLAAEPDVVDAGRVGHGGGRGEGRTVAHGGHLVRDGGDTGPVRAGARRGSVLTLTA
ncbi:putative hydrolase/lactonase [Streptomyces sp. Tu6071]|nr:putative hydrolase/lactonase [Streptomyces sp. Tu6071]